MTIHRETCIHYDEINTSNDHKGVLLAASTKDGDQGLYPVAYAITDSENLINWRFFLQCLNEELSKYPMRQVTFMSDRNIGLLSAFKEVFPGSPLGFCLRHLKDNLAKKYACGNYLKDRIPSLFQKCAYARTIDTFELNMQLLRNEGGNIIDEFLADLPKETWANAFFAGQRYGDMTNNLAESFNSWITSLKNLPIVDLNEAIRCKFMVNISGRKESSKEWHTVLCPKIEKKLHQNMDIGRHWLVRMSDTNSFEVQCQKYNIVVNLISFECSCGEWQVHGFPCGHALAVVQQYGFNPYDYVNEYFKVERYKETYSFAINAIPSISKPINMPQSTILIQPPLTRRPPGRPRTRRFRSRSEVVRNIRCGRCGLQDGHNRASCKNPI